MTILDILDEYKRKNDFFKKETILIGFIVSFWLVFMYYLNKWEDTILFITIAICLFVLIYKVYDIYSVRITKFDNLMKRIIKEKNEENEDEWSDFKVFTRKEKQEPKITVTEFTKEGSQSHDIDQPLKFKEKDLEDALEKLKKQQEKLKELSKRDIEWESSEKASKIVKERVEERKAKMKLFNYKFRESSQYFDFLNYLEKSYYNKQIPDDNFFTIFKVYADYLNDQSPETYKKLLDRNTLENLIVQLQEQKKSTKEENEEAN